MGGDLEMYKTLTMLDRSDAGRFSPLGSGVQNEGSQSQFIGLGLS